MKAIINWLNGLKMWQFALLGMAFGLLLTAILLRFLPYPTVRLTGFIGMCISGVGLTGYGLHRLRVKLRTK